MGIRRRGDDGDDAFGIPKDVRMEIESEAERRAAEELAARRAADAETAEGLADAELRRQLRDQMNAGEDLTGMMGGDLNMVESAIAVHEMYQSYVRAGFERAEALWLVATVMTGGPRLPAYLEQLLRGLHD